MGHVAMMHTGKRRHIGGLGLLSLVVKLAIKEAMERHHGAAPQTDHSPSREPGFMGRPDDIHLVSPPGEVSKKINKGQIRAKES